MGLFSSVRYPETVADYPLENVLGVPVYCLKADQGNLLIYDKCVVIDMGRGVCGYRDSGELFSLHYKVIPLKYITAVRIEAHYEKGYLEFSTYGYETLNDYKGGHYGHVANKENKIEFHGQGSAEMARQIAEFIVSKIL